MIAWVADAAKNVVGVGVSGYSSRSGWNWPSDRARGTDRPADAGFSQARRLLRSLAGPDVLQGQYWLGNQGPFSTYAFDEKLRALSRQKIRA